MAEEEQEFHVCSLCGADDILSEPFYKAGIEQYWCPDCRRKKIPLPDEWFISPCTCGAKPIVDLVNGYIKCPECGIAIHFIPFNLHNEIDSWSRLNES